MRVSSGKLCAGVARIWPFGRHSSCPLIQPKRFSSFVSTSTQKLLCCFGVRTEEIQLKVKPLKVTNLSFETWSLHMLDSWLNSTTSRGGKWDPNGLLRQTYRNSNKTFQNMNLASFYLCLLMNINTSARPLWNAISRERKTTIKIKSHKYTHYFRGRFTFSVFFFPTSLFLGNFRHEAQVVIHTRLLRMNTITWESKKNQ